MKKHLEELANFILIATAISASVYMAQLNVLSIILFFAIGCALYLVARFVKE